MDVLVIQAEAVQYDLSVPQAGEDGPAQGLRLLHDLLKHEVLIAAFFRRVNLPIHMGGFFLHRLEQVVVTGHALPGQLCQLPVLQVDDVPGIFDEGGHIGGQEVESLAQPQDQRAVLAHGDEPVRFIRADNAQGIGSLNTVKHPAHSLEDISVIKILDELCHHLGVCLRGKRHPLADQEVLQLGIIFDDAVVDYRDAAAAADLGMRVDV